MPLVRIDLRAGKSEEYQKALGDGEANASVELQSAIGKFIYPVVLDYLKGKKDWPKWVLIPSNMHHAAMPAD